MIKGVIFDLYDTLVHIDGYQHPHKKFLLSLGLTRSELEEAEYICNTRNFNSFDSLLKEIKPSLTKMDTSVYDNMAQEDVDSTHLLEGTISTLQRLSQKYRIFLISNLATDYKKPYFNLKLYEYIEKPFFSCDMGCMKPEPKIFQEVIKYSKLECQELVMIGDSLVDDVAGAKNVGMKSIHKDRNKDLRLITIDL